MAAIFNAAYRRSVRQTGRDVRLELELRDGRVVGVTDYGDPDGVPVYFFHGLPSCRLEASFASEAARRAGVLLISVDRPGFGRSSFRPYRPLARFADDIAELADRRSLSRFAVIGVSAGGPFALATAAALPRRVAAVATVGGFFAPKSASQVAGMNAELRASLFIARAAPWMMRPLFALTARAVKRSDTRFLKAVARRSPAPDRELLRVDAIRSHLLVALREAFAHGARGAAWEQRLLVQDWGFTPDSIDAPVTVWQGGLDRNVPADLGRSLASWIPRSRLEFFEGEGHLSLMHNRIDDVLRGVVRGFQRRF